MWSSKLNLLIGAVILLAPAKSVAATALLELKVDETAYQGRIEVRSPSHCWLMDRDGRLNAVELEQVQEYRKVAPDFRSVSHADLRNRLLKEFGSEFEVAATQHYVVCAAHRQAEAYAQLFEDVYRSFYLYFKIRKFNLTQPEFPLVAVVFPDRQAFAEYSRHDGVTARPGLLGFYSPKSNRVALFDPAVQTVSSREPISSDERLATPFTHSSINWPPKFPSTAGSPAARFSGAEDKLKDTIIHEATHQIAFNTGLHNRIGESPQWVVEGLATVFEAPGVHDGSGNRSKSSRMNRDRFIWFQNFAASRRKTNSLSNFITSDDLFQTATLDAYSQAWALTFFLVETRPWKYVAYLKTIAARDRLSKYSPEQRLVDFQSSIENKLELLDTEFLRFIDRLK